MFKKKKKESTRVVLPYRHIMEDGSIRKVERSSEGTLYIGKTNEVISAKKMTHKDNIVPIGNNKFKFKRNKSVKSGGKQTYEDWWQENNLNGGFAYNGSANDF